MNEIEPTREQIGALQYEGSFVAIAKPGSGKTYLLSEKIRRILPTIPLHKGVIAISYTNKASSELHKRSTRNGIDTKSSFFGTIDKFCTREIIIPFLPQLWGNPLETISVVKIIDLPQDEQEQFNKILSNQISVKEIIEHEGVFSSYFRKGKIFLETIGALSIHILTSSPACSRFIKSRYTHIIIDEFQDSGFEQNVLFLKLQQMGLIAIAVGDADQSIFGFSGKDSKYLLELGKRDDFKLFSISLNHRCHSSIINYSQLLLNENAEMIDTPDIRIFEKTCNGNQTNIAKWIETTLPRIVEKFDVKNNSDIAILSRTSLTGDIINKSLTIKHRYFESHPLEDDFSLWSQLFCQLLRYRYNSEITAQEILDETISTGAVNDIRTLRNLVKGTREIGNEKIVEHFEVIATKLIPHARSTKSLDMLEDSLGEDLGKFFGKANKDEIQVMSIHKAKGLEFDIIFHTDLYEWSFPSKRPGPNKDFDNPVFTSPKEDHNLHYVSITRAKKACFLCTSSKRIKKRYDSDELEERNATPSEFLRLRRLMPLRSIYD